MGQDLFLKMISTSEDEINAMADTGMFNGIIEGYLIATLRSLDYSDPDIQEAVRTLHRLLDSMDAAEARQEYIDMNSIRIYI